MIPCPHCGEPISETARACRHCGSDAETGWSDDVDYHSVELPDDDDVEPLEHRRNRLRALGLLVLIGLLGSSFAFGSVIWRWARTPVGKVISIAAVFVITLTVLRMLRHERQY